MPATAAPHLDAVALRLELHAGLAAAPSGLSFGEWVRLLAPLGATDARVVVLRVIHGLTDREVAERLGVSRNRCYERWRRALARLAESPAAARLLSDVGDY